MKIKATIWAKEKSWAGIGNPYRLEITQEDLQKLAYSKFLEGKSFPEDWELHSVDFNNVEL